MKYSYSGGYKILTVSNLIKSKDLQFQCPENLSKNLDIKIAE